MHFSGKIYVRPQNTDNRSNFKIIQYNIIIYCYHYSINKWNRVKLSVWSTDHMIIYIVDSVPTKCSLNILILRNIMNMCNLRFDLGTLVVVNLNSLLFECIISKTVFRLLSFFITLEKLLSVKIRGVRHICYRAFVWILLSVNCFRIVCIEYLIKEQMEKSVLY